MRSVAAGAALAAAVVRKELAVLWASPLPWSVGVLLHLVLGFLYVNELEARGQALSQPMIPLAGFLLVVLVPALSMRSVAEEARTGTLDVLLAVPVRVLPLVAGKWVAVWATAIACLLPAAVVLAVVSRFGALDVGPVVAGFLGLALLAAAVAGVGVLTSSATSSQPVAALTALFVALLLWFAHAGDVVAPLSLSERLRAFAGGGIDSADALFFVAVTVASLVVAASVVEGRRLR